MKLMTNDKRIVAKARVKPTAEKTKQLTPDLVLLDDLAAVESELMKAADAFSYQWGRDQTIHPPGYWLDLHITTWRRLAKAALAYSECASRIATKPQTPD